MDDGFAQGFAVGAGAMFVLFLLFVGGFWIIRPWLQMILSGGRGSIFHVIGMRLRGTSVTLVIDAYTSLVQRGENVSLRQVESQYIAHRDRIVEARDLIDLVTRQVRHDQAKMEKNAKANRAAQAAPPPATKIVPYNIDSKPMPAGKDLNQLLPESVGDFRRGELRVVDPTGPIYAAYTDSTAEIWMELGICGSPAGAQQAIETVRAEAADVTVATEAYSLGTEPSYLKLRVNNPRLDGSRVSISWTRGPYFFTAGTASDATLKRFMHEFPY